MDRVQDFKSALMGACRNYWKGGLACPKRVVLKSLPLLTEKTFEGRPLRSVMSPLVPDTGVMTESLFDIFIWPHHRKEGDSEKDLLEASSRDLVSFVLKGTNLGEQILWLLYALGNADGARLAFDRNSIMVHHDQHSYGIIDGVVHSRFCTGFKVNADHWEFLHRRWDITCLNESVCILWREAYRKGPGTVAALTALVMGQPRLNWKKMLDSVLPNKMPTNAQFDSWIATLHTAQDPLAKLYKELVPAWMTASDFGRVFCRIKNRPECPGESSKQAYITKLYAFMYQKTRKEGQ